MKTKKLSTVKIFLVITAIVYLVATVLFCYQTKPAVTEGEFPFSITYQYKGETKTFSGVFKCKYSGSESILGEHNRYWDGEAIYDNPAYADNPNIIDYSDEMQTSLALYENMYAGYFMGDPLYADCYEEQGLAGVEPRVSYCDYQNDIILDEENKDEVLESVGFEIIEFTYAEPIENSFSFSGIEYEPDNILVFFAIALVFFLLCLIFIRKDQEYRYSKLDKAGIILNFLIGLLAVPFIYSMCFLFGLAESNAVLIDQITYNIPSIEILCLALSVVCRRKGYSKTGFYIQFGGILPFALIFILELLFKFH